MSKIKSTLFEEELRSSKPRNANTKTNISYQKTSDKKSSFSKKNPNNVVVKITGGATSSKSAGRHLDYISRNNQLDVFGQEGNKIDYDILQNESRRLIETDDSRSDSKKSYQMIFSTPGTNDKEILSAAILSTAQEEFKGYEFYFSIHEDTNNTHGHLVVYRNSMGTGKRLKIGKNKLNKIKQSYNKHLNRLGIKSYFQSHSDKFKSVDNSNIHKFRKPRTNSNHFKLVEYGVAPYKFNVGSQDSFYVLLENKNGVRKQHWSWGLKDEIEKTIKRGDLITLKKISGQSQSKSVWNIEKIEAQINKEMYSITDYGKANYRFHESTKESFYLFLKSAEGKVKQVWNKKLEKFLTENNLKKGDTLTITDTNLMLDNQSLSINRQEFTKILSATRAGREVEAQPPVDKKVSFSAALKKVREEEKQPDKKSFTGLKF